MDSWWQLGEYGGHDGKKPSFWQIQCPFCEEKGHFSIAFHAVKKKPNTKKVLNFDTLECTNCKGYVMVLWSSSEWSQETHQYRVLPWPLRWEKYPDYWPATVGRYWLQAKRNLSDENWDAAVLMARSSLQAALRNTDAKGHNLKQEIDFLADKGILPPILQEWAHNLRELGNDTAHPRIETAETSAKDASDIVHFLDFFLEYLYDLPKRIAEYTGRKPKKEE